MTAAHDELYSLLVPLNQERLIVPRACVAEVVRYAPLHADEPVPHWFRGHVAWNGRRVPVISFEELAGRAYKTSRAWEYRFLFGSFWEHATAEEAERFFKKWFRRAVRSKLASVNAIRLVSKLMAPRATRDAGIGR